MAENISIQVKDAFKISEVINNQFFLYTKSLKSYLNGLKNPHF